MSIKMPIKFHGSYRVVTRYSGIEKQELCQKLSITPLADREQGTPEAGAASPTHMITYFCFGCRRVLEGRIKEDGENKVVFQADEREFEFSPSEKRC
ncbi:MAG: hypothetical protein AB9866_09270 [Syntrophobacteraceae bacterium]